MSENEKSKPNLEHPDVLKPGQEPPPAKFSSPPIGAPIPLEKNRISPDTAAHIGRMTPQERDGFFRNLLKTEKPEDIARIYGVGEAYLAVVADDDDSDSQDSS